MGKTKIKTIDDSQSQIEEKKTKKQETPVEIDGENEVSQETTSEQEAVKESPTKSETKKNKSVKKYHSKKYQQAIEQVNPEQNYSVDQAIELAQKTSYTKFPGSIEIHINTAVKNIRGNVSLPHMAGKQLKILAFGKDAKEAGADIIGTDETISEIEKGKVLFDAVVATPEWMPKLAKVAKILGPRGLMPSPKNDTVTENLIKAITELRGGKTEYKTENNGQVIHLLIGKVNQPAEEIRANIKTLYNVIGRSKIQKITLSSTMGPGVKVNPASI